MKITAWYELTLYAASLAILVPLLGGYCAMVLGGGKVPLFGFLRPIELFIYRVSNAGCTGGENDGEMNWKEYASCVLMFSFLGVVSVTLLQMFQGYLPMNTQKLGSPSFPLALNTAISFVTNTNWQAYAGETTLSYLTQMIGLSVQNFVSAAAGIAVMAALARGVSRRQSHTIGNFWGDLVRITLYILLPLSFITAILLLSQGVVQTFAHYPVARTIEGVQQTLPLGPAASQVAIKQIGTNGGGFFGVNSTHPFENPTPFSNFIECLSILLLPAALVYSFGILAGKKRHGIALLAAMTVIFACGLGAALWAELHGNPALGGLPFMEGKEVRFGIMPSVLWGMSTTAASNGSVNAMQGSFSPIAGGVAIFNMMMGEVVYGGVGSGVYGMVLFAILTVFIAGLKVGRTPEYLGKKIEARDVMLAVAGVLLPCAAVLIFSSISIVTAKGLSGLSNGGPHGLSEILYAFTSASNNNGSAFAGLNASTPWYTVLTSIAMLTGRFGVIIPVLALADSLCKKKITPPSPGTFPTDGAMFVALLIGVVIIVGALTFLPALTLGPVMEHFLMLRTAVF